VTSKEIHIMADVPKSTISLRRREYELIIVVMVKVNSERNPENEPNSTKQKS
jgi:hypothetical protein